MKATLLRTLSPGTAVFQCNPPMKFLKSEIGEGKGPITPEVIESELVVVWSGEVVPGFQRAVLHHAARLAGEQDGPDMAVIYGGMASNQLDGIHNYADVFGAFGYQVIGDPDPN